MSDDEADPELLELLRQHLLGTASTVDPDADTGVLESAEYVNDNAIDVALDMRSCKNAAEAIYGQMQRKHYSLATWGEHELHPTARDESTVDFIFTMDLLNFSFWSDEEAGSGGGSTTTTAVAPAANAASAGPPYRGGGFAVEYRGKTWTGYYSMVAALRRALDEGIPITSPAFWRSNKCDMALMRRVFRPAGSGDVEDWHDDAVEQRDGDAGDFGGAGDAANAGNLADEVAPSVPITVPGVAAGPAGEGDVLTGDLASEENGQANGKEAVSSAGVVNGAGDAHDEVQQKRNTEGGASEVDGDEKSAMDAGEAVADGGIEATNGAVDRREEPNDTDVSERGPSETPGAAHASTRRADDGPSGTSSELPIRTVAAPAAVPLAPAVPSSSLPEMPLLAERLACLKEAGQVLEERFGDRVVNVLDAAGGSAAKLVNILAREFSCFRDECPFPDTSSKPGGSGSGSGSSHADNDDADEGYGFAGGGRSRRRRRTVRFLKRAQILAAELWACFQGTGYGAFRDVGKLTMFADYRVPQMLQALGCLYYSPPLQSAIQAKRLLPHGGSWEVQLRGCSIWCVELIRREIKNKHPDAEVNAVLIDFFLYDTMKEMEAAGKDAFPHHRTRSIWY